MTAENQRFERPSGEDRLAPIPIWTGEYR